MKTTMKKTVACLLALLLVMQIVPVFADSTISEPTKPIDVLRDQLEIRNAESIIPVGATISLEVTEGYNVKWSSSNEEVATVSEDGVVTALSAGTVTITAKEDKYSDKVTIQVIGGETEAAEEEENENNEDNNEDNNNEEKDDEEAAPSKKKIIVINGQKQKLTYDGEEHTNEFTYSGNFEIDGDKIICSNPDTFAKATDCGVARDKLDAADFSYEGDDKVQFVVSDGWIQIKPASVIVKADDKVVAKDETPEFTATVTGLVEGDDPELIQYTLEVIRSNGVNYITPVCEQNQGNYRVTAKPGILTTEDWDYTDIRITSDLKEGEPAYIGTLITMKAELTGFEDIEYELQWQYSTDMKNWTDVPGANDITYTYELNETTVQYAWRVVVNYKGTEQQESEPFKQDIELIARPAAVDITDNTSFSYTDKNGKGTTIDAMDPNSENRMKMIISGLNEISAIDKQTRMIISVPENIMVNQAELPNLNNDKVNVELEDGALSLTWKNEKFDALELTLSVLPNIPVDNDLSGSYVLGTGGNQYYKLLLGTSAFNDSSKPKRKRLSGIAFEEVEGKVYILSEDAAPVWKLEHVSENYYTVRSNENGKYLRIDDVNEGLILEEATEFTAQKLLVESVGNGYYSFRYKNKSINNSSFNSVKGFASYKIETGLHLNAILKLYNPSDVITEAKHDVSGTWVITNAAKNNVITAEKLSTNGRLAAISYTADGDRILVQDEITTFTFKHIVRDWYTVKTDNGYLNISKEGAFISDTPQHLAVQTDNQYSSIILTDSEQRDLSFKNVGYVLNNMNGKTSDGYGAVIYTFSDNSRLTLTQTSKAINENDNSHGVLAFDINGGTGAENPATIEGESGQEIVLPDLNATMDGHEFIGWAEVSDIYTVNKAVNHRYQDFYKPGTTYKLKAGQKTLYAIYNTTKGTVTFGIRKDGVIQDEPHDNKKEAYFAHFTVNEILKENHWVIDIDSTKPVHDYYLENNVTANLKWVPSAEQIAAALKKEGVDFDPETQYIHYYVLKCTGIDVWKVDGVIRNKAKVSVTYDANVPAGVDKTKVTNKPGGYQVNPGTDILIGADENSSEIKRPGINGYYFMGWNTKKDGSGEYYSENSTIHLTENLYLYAQWIDANSEALEIRITSDWANGKQGYVGARITLTAELTGFENKEYTLQWQYTTDPESGNWIDVPDAHDITYTYTLDEKTTHYTWRIIAKDIR